MLELSAFQIFFMVLSACSVIFSLAYLMTGHKNSSSDKILSYYDEKFRRQRNFYNPPSVRKFKSGGTFDFEEDTAVDVDVDVEEGPLMRDVSEVSQRE